ncbi:hypothetical protein QBC37DRAFT_451765 [Rhypophila decipiens]|uniref:Uncharacterized protein n=1 Tax=Rhypophila decipiens TaxID=261697 RepID=A0AAN6Y0A7_9PEZI|nr:hypothetical protein QBC37DRAFT_451765 [Rhypophila decipiens]
MFARAALWTLALTGCLLVSGLPVVSPEPQKKTPASVPLGLHKAYTLSRIHWKGVLEEGKPEVYLIGDDFDDIEAQAKAIHPNYTIFEENQHAQPEANNNTRGLSTREVRNVDCWQRDDSGAQIHALREGIAYLKRVTSWCRGDPAGDSSDSCGRVSCSWGAGIFYCNQKREENWQPCSSIAPLADLVANQCYLEYGKYKDNSSQGEAFDTEGWSAWVYGGIEC